MKAALPTANKTPGTAHPPSSQPAKRAKTTGKEIDTKSAGLATPVVNPSKPDNSKPAASDEKSSERQSFEAKVNALKEFVSLKQTEIERLTRDIATLEGRLTTTLHTRADLTDLKRIELALRRLKGTRELLQDGVDDDLLTLRLNQMLDFYAQIPASDKTEQSLLEAWSSSFDISAMTPRTLAKDHCEACHRPLVLIKKQALLSCVGCARLTEHLMPLSHATVWMKPSTSGGGTSQPENKRFKAIISKLLQFKVGGPPIPPSVVLTVKEYLRARHHGGGGLAQLTPVVEALEARDLHRYVNVAGKIANLLNGQEITEVSEDQVNDIVSRLRATQAACNLIGSVFYASYFTNRICELRALPAVAAAFPPNRTNRILREQISSWRRVHSRLRMADSTHDW
jgi:hypothetical protein